MIHLRINGRIIRPGCLISRRFFLGALGVDRLRVPRSQNPFAIARRLRRYLQSGDELVGFKKLARRPAGPPVSPDVDHPEPVFGDDHAAAAE